jgi:hypothetical protein
MTDLSQENFPADHALFYAKGRLHNLHFIAASSSQQATKTSTTSSQQQVGVEEGAASGGVDATVGGTGNVNTSGNKGTLTYSSTSNLTEANVNSEGGVAAGEGANVAINETDYSADPEVIDAATNALTLAGQTVNAAGNDEAVVTLQAGQEVENVANNAISANTDLAANSENVAMESALATNNALASIESGIEGDQQETTEEAAAVNLSAEGSPGYAYSLAGTPADEGGISAGGEPKAQTFYYVLAGLAALGALWYYLHQANKK